MPVKKSPGLKREERRKLVAANLLAGLNYREMAERLDVSIGTIKNDVDIILKRAQKEQVSGAEQWLAVQVRRLDRAINAIWGNVLNGDPQAIDRLQRLIDQQAKYLGYDKPLKLDWRIEVVSLLMAGKITPAEVEEELGVDVARELFESIGLPVAASGETEAQG